MHNELCVECMAEWLRHWTRDQGFWDSVHPALVMCKSLGQSLNPHCLWPPSSSENQVERNIGTVWMAPAAEIVLHSAQGDETVKE